MQIDRDTVIALATAHAICTSGDSKEFDHDGLERFAQAIAQRAAEAEREACARVCKSESERARFNFQDDLEENELFWNGAEQMAHSCLESIRARGAQEE